MEIAERRLWMRKEMLYSLVLHALCISAIVIFSACLAKVPETVRIVLTLDSPGGGGGGGGGGGNVQTASEPERPPARPVRGLQKRDGIRPMERVAHRSPAEDILPAVNAAPAARTGQTEASMRPLPNDVSVTSWPGAGATASGGEGTGSWGGKGSGTGPGTGSGSGAGSGSGIGSGIGSGSGSSAGRGRGRGESSESPRNRYLREHFEYIRDLILKNLSYPPMAKKLGWSGTVKVSFVVQEDGRVEAMKILDSSGYDLLDQNVMETIREVQPFPKPPVRAELVIPVAYTLKLSHATGRK